MSSGDSTAGLPAIFDGHNDTLLRLFMAGNKVDPFFAGRSGHLDLPRARAGGFGGGFFAVFVPSVGDDDILALGENSEGALATRGAKAKKAESKPKKSKSWSRDNAPYSPRVSFERSVAVAEAVIDLAERFVERSEGKVLWMKSWRISVVRNLRIRKIDLEIRNLYAWSCTSRAPSR